MLFDKLFLIVNLARLSMIYTYGFLVPEVGHPISVSWCFDGLRLFLTGETHDTPVVVASRAPNHTQGKDESSGVLARASPAKSALRQRRLYEIREFPPRCSRFPAVLRFLSAHPNNRFKSIGTRAAATPLRDACVR